MTVRPVVRTSAGFVLIGAGVIGTLLPVIPGIPLIVAGAALLGSDHPLVRGVTARISRWRRGDGGPGET